MLASEGRHFCAGLDFAGNAGQDIAALYRAALRLFAAPLPVVAAVQGAAIGGGCGLALSADFRVATPQSRFSANFARLGFHHGFALTRDAAGGGRAPGRGGPAAHRAARRRRGGAGPRPVRPPGRATDDLLAQAHRLRRRAGRGGTAGRPRHPGHAARRAWSRRPRLAMEHECAEQTRLRDTADFAEGVRAAAERRDPLLPRGVRRGRAPAAHELQHVLHLGRARGPVPRHHRGAGAPVRRARLLRAGGRARRAARWTALIEAIDPFEERRGRRAARARGRPLLHRPGRRDHLHHPPGAAVAGAARVHRARALLTDVCADLIGPDVRLYWDQAVYKKPGTESPFPWHQDNGYAFVEPQQYLTCWVALTDATEENGCPWVVPGLHRRGTLAHEYSDIGFVCLRDPADAVAVPARAGSIVVFSSLTPHSTGPNRTDAVRKAYIVQYAPAGAEVVRPEPGGPAQRVPADDEAASTRCCARGERVTR